MWVSGCKNRRNNSGSRDGTASAGRKRHAVATWTGILVVRTVEGLVEFLSLGLQVLMFWFLSGCPKRSVSRVHEHTLSPFQESPFLSDIVVFVK